jgi:hypothetical protein
MWKDVLETFRIVVRAKKNLPGITVEELFGNCTTEQLEKEYTFLEQQAKDSGYVEDETGLRGQYGGHRE